MATLAGQKIKDKYGNLLHVEGGATSTLKSVEDGGGTATALSVSTDKVQVDALKFTTAPASGSSATALALDGNNDVILVSVGGSTSLANLTDVSLLNVTSGEFLYYDGSGDWVNKTSSELGLLYGIQKHDDPFSYVTPNTNGMILFEAGSNMAITYSGNTVSFASSASGSGVFEETFVGTNSTAHPLSNSGDADIVAWSTPTNTSESTSFHFGNSPAQLELDTSVGEYIKNITENDLIVMVDMSASLEVASQGANITYTLQRGNNSTWTNVKSVTRYKSSSGSQIDSFWGMFILGGGERLRVQISTTTGNVSLSAGSQFMFTVKETGDIL